MRQYIFLIMWCFLLYVSAYSVNDRPRSIIGQEYFKVVQSTDFSNQSSFSYRFKEWACDRNNYRLCNRLSTLCEAFSWYEPYVLAAMTGVYIEEPDVEYPFLFLELPGMRSLKKNLFIQKSERAWSWYVRLYWTVMLASAVVQMGMYGAYALAAPQGQKVCGPGLDSTVHDEYDNYNGDYYMPFDIRMIWWKYGPKNNVYRGILSLISAAIAAIACKRELCSYVEHFRAQRLQEELLKKAVEGVALMRSILAAASVNTLLREVVIDLGVGEVLQDVELSEICSGLLEDTMNTMSSSGVSRCLTNKKNQILRLFMCVGRIEAYVVSAVHLHEG